MVKKIGQWKLGMRNVDLIVDTKYDGGSVEFTPDKGGPTAIIIGLDCQDLSECISTYLHEIFEMVYVQMGTRYSQSTDWSNESSAYTFMMTHNEFGSACGHVAGFLKESFAPLCLAYTKNEKKR